MQEDEISKAFFPEKKPKSQPQQPPKEEQATKQPEITKHTVTPTHPQDIYHGPEKETLDPKTQPRIKGRTEMFIDISLRGIKLSREHVCTPTKVTLCKDCGKVLDGGEHLPHEDAS